MYRPTTNIQGWVKGLFVDGGGTGGLFYLFSAFEVALQHLPSHKATPFGQVCVCVGIITVP